MITERQSKAIKKKLVDLNQTVTDLAVELDIKRTYLSSIINRSISNADKENIVLKWYRSKTNKKGE